MPVRQKAILINASIVVALIYQFWRGTPLFIMVISGILVLVAANLMMMFAAKSKRDVSTNSVDAATNPRDPQ
jgi:hypothetical protein